MLSLGDTHAIKAPGAGCCCAGGFRSIPNHGRLINTNLLHPLTGRDRVPITRTTYLRTRTKTVIRRRTVSAKVNRRSAPEIELEPVQIDAAIMGDAQEAGEHSLFARNLCARCPKRAAVLPARGKTSGGAGVSFCCWSFLSDDLVLPY